MVGICGRDCRSGAEANGSAVVGVVVMGMVSDEGWSDRLFICFLLVGVVIGGYEYDCF